MAPAGVEEEEYDSDPEEVKRSLAMRRREAASDDEEEGEREGIERRVDRQLGIHSDQLDYQGGIGDYNDEEEEEEEELVKEGDEEDDEEQEEEYEEGYEGEGGEVYVEKTGEGDAHGAGRVDGWTVLENERDSDFGTHLQESEDVHSGNRDDEEEKKEIEPFAVPTAGAFYMHDDRFRDNAGSRHRRTHGGRRLWESKDERKWGHDKFEEMTLQERHHGQGRRSRTNYRGQGKSRGIDQGYAQVNRKGYIKTRNEGQVHNGVRGRGPRRYEPSAKNNGQAPQIQHRRRYGNSVEKSSNASSGRPIIDTSNVEPESVLAKKQVLSSSLNSASPPFYPPGASSNKDMNLVPKGGIQTGGTAGSINTNNMDEDFSVAQNSAFPGKNAITSVGMEKPYIEDSTNPVAVKSLNNQQMLSLGSLGINNSQSSQLKIPGRSVPGQTTNQPGPPQNYVNRISSSQLQPVHHSSSQVQTSVQTTAQQLGQRPGSGSQTSSPSQTSHSINSFESAEGDSMSDLGISKNALVGKGKGSAQGSGRGSFLYGGAQVIGASGNMGVSHGDQNFPAFLPVMQFGGQHPGGIGVPAVGMAFPGYVAQPQLSVGNSEMTWLPVLAGATGALGGYCSPYLAVDGAYHARQSGQTSSGSSSKENGKNKASNEQNPSQRPEIVSNESGQRQNKPRRYSEMNFGH